MGRRETAAHIFNSIGRKIRHDIKENNVIDCLGSFGPHTVSSLKRKTHLLSSRGTLSNSEIYRVLEELKTKGVVKEFHKERGAVFGLTFKGMIDYLRNDGPELDIRKVTHLVNLFENPLGGAPPKRSAKHKQMVATRAYLEKLFPFLPAWKSIVESI